MEVALHSLHSESQESAKIRVNECEYAKKLENRFCSSLHFLFLTAAIFADFCIFYVPPPSLGILPNRNHRRYTH